MFNLFQILSSLLVSPYFFLDVLYVHELPSELNLCKVSSIECYHKIFGAFVVKFLACLPLLGFSNIYKMV